MCLESFLQVQNAIHLLLFSHGGVMRDFTEALYEKAISEPSTSILCAHLARHVYTQSKNSNMQGGLSGSDTQSFLRLLLNKCESEFEESLQTWFTPWDELMDEEEREAVENRRRKRSLGRIIFIGELYKVHLLTTKIIHSCVQRLLQAGMHGDEDRLGVMY